MKACKKSFNIICAFLIAIGSFLSVLPTTFAATTLYGDTFVCADHTAQTSCYNYGGGTIAHIYNGNEEDSFGTEIHRLVDESGDSYWAYCLEPNVDVTYSTGAYTSKTWSSSGLNLTTEQINQIELIAHFGYEYGDHEEDSFYYLAAQILIWEVVDPDIQITLANRKTGEAFTAEDYEEYEQYEEEILNLVNNFKKTPSFAGQTITGKLEQGVTLTDTNGVLSNWNVTTDSDCDVVIDGNTLTVTCDEAQNVTLNMSRKGLSDTASVVYTATGYQTLGVLSLNTPITASAQVNLVDVEYPVITKSVSQSEIEIGEEFKYFFEYTIDELEDGIYYESFLIEDTFEPVLKLTDTDQVIIYNEEGEDVTDLYNIVVYDNKLEITVKDLTNDDFYGHTYTVEVTTELLSSVDLSSYESNGLYTIPNEVTLTVDGHVSTDDVPVTYEVVIIEVPDTAARLPLIILGGGLVCIAAGVGGYYFLLKKRGQI